MIRPKLILASGKEKSLLRRHPWVFSGAVKSRVGKPAPGDLVDVCDVSSNWLAVGHFQDDSIICKILSFDTPDVDSETHPEFWEKLLRNAVDCRLRLGFLPDDRGGVCSYFPTTDTFRLIHAEGDFLPGLVADYYNGIIVLQAHSVGMHRIFPLISRLLVEIFEDIGFPLSAIFDKSSATLPGGGCEDGYIWGDEPLEWEICEDGNRMLINFYEGQKTGFFVDQRENRHLVGCFAKGKRVLNCFGYTGGFSLGALRGGASYVETVDISKKAIDLCNRNVALNFDPSSHRGVVADVLKYLDTIPDTFDVIILDPPAFAKSHRNLQHGLKGYRNINQKAIEKIKPGGLLFSFSCSQAVSPEDFQTMIFTAAANAHRNVRIVRKLPHALDHPVSIFHPEGEYLKGLLLYVE